MPTLTPVPFSPSYVNFVFGDEVSDEHEHAVRLGVEAMHDYSVSLGRPDLDHDIYVYAFDDFESLVDEVYEAWRDIEGDGFSKDYVRSYFSNGNFLGLAASNDVFINTLTFDNVDFYYVDRNRQIHVTAHEFNHAQCNNLGALGLDNAYAQNPDVEPRWLNEGVAEFLTWQALSEGGIVSYDDQRKYFFPYVLDAGPLKELETRTGFRSDPSHYQYEYSTLAVEFLASHAGQSSLLGFYASLTLGVAWEDQFRETFGMSVSDFYDRFSEHEANGFPELETPKFVDP